MELSRQITQDIAVQNSLIILSELKRFMPSNTGMIPCFLNSIFVFFVLKILTTLFDRCFIYNRVQGGLIVQPSVTVLTSTGHYSGIKIVDHPMC